MSLIWHICVIVLNVFGQRHIVADEGAGADGRLGTFHAQTFERHDLGVRRFPAQVLDDVEIALDHLDHGAPPAAGFLMEKFNKIYHKKSKYGVFDRGSCLCNDSTFFITY